MKTQTRLVLTAVGMALVAGSAQAVSTNPLAPYLDAGYAIAPDKQLKGLVLFNASAASDATTKTPTSWSFTAADAGSAFKMLMEDSSNAPMNNPDEAKLRDGGRTLLLTGSWWSGWAEIDVATKQARRYAKTGTSGTDTWNTHSIDKLPDGTLVIANSMPPDNATGGAVNYCNGLVLITTDANGNHAYKKAFSLYGAHGVEWDPVRNCLWAIGNAYENNVKGQATLYKLAYDPSAKTLTELAAIEVRAKSDGTDTGHGLRLAVDGKLYCSAADAYVVDPDTNPATVTKLDVSHTHDIKGVARDATYGLVLQESGYISGASDNFLNDHVTVYPVSGSSYDVYPAGGTRMYKVSWASALPATFVPYLASGDSFWCGGDGTLADVNCVNDDRTSAKAAFKAGNRLVFGGYESPDVTIGAATTAAGIVAAHGTTTISGAALTLTGAIETGDADAVVIVKGPVAGAITKTGKGTLVLEGANDDVTALNVQAGTVAVSNALPSGVTANVSPGATFIDGSSKPVDPEPPAPEQPGVSNVSWTQDPVTREVTVTYGLGGSTAIVTFDVLTNGVSIGGKAICGGDGPHPAPQGDVFRRVKIGVGRSFTWQPDRTWGVDFGTVDAQIVVKAWPLADPPDYMIVNLVTNNVADPLTFYPGVDWVPGGIVTNKAYRMTSVPMRRIHAKDVTWTMGSYAAGMAGQDKGTAERVNVPDPAAERMHAVTLTNDYYIGVFEVTYAQGKSSLATIGASCNCYGTDSDLRPLDQSSYGAYREGTAAGDTNYRWPKAPHPGTVFGKLRALTGIVFDMPGEAQWEFAARAGHGDGYWPNGRPVDVTETDALMPGSPAGSMVKDASLDKMARYYGTTPTVKTGSSAMTYEGGTAACGMLEPNSWGLYDMLGNVSEFCIDGYKKDITGLNGAIVAPSSLIIFRGGFYAAGAAMCRPGYRHQTPNISSDPYKVGTTTTISSGNSSRNGIRLASPIAIPDFND